MVMGGGVPATHVSLPICQKSAVSYAENPQHLCAPRYLVCLPQPHSHLGNYPASSICPLEVAGQATPLCELAGEGGCWNPQSLSCPPFLYPTKPQLLEDPFAQGGTCHCLRKNCEAGGLQLFPTQTRSTLLMSGRRVQQAIRNKIFFLALQILKSER